MLSRTFVTFITLPFLLFSLCAHSEQSLTPSEIVNRIFARLAAVRLPLDSPLRTTAEGLATEGKLLEIAELATEQDGFYNVTLRHWAAPFGNRDETYLLEFNDLIAMIIGTVRDDRDFREILYENFNYVGPTETESGTALGQASAVNNNHYINLERNGVNYAQTLTRREVQHTDPKILFNLAGAEFTEVPDIDIAGVLTSQTFIGSHADAGTNRRLVEYSFGVFLCKPISELADPLVSDHLIRRDVERLPGGDVSTYQTSCRGCHGGMDALANAFFYYGHSGARSVAYYHSSVAASRIYKYVLNRNVYPQGNVTTSNEFVNLWTERHNASLGWRGPTEGEGVKAFGKMLANSRAFSDCMARRIFTYVCSRGPTAEEEATLSDLADAFEASDYDLKVVFQQATILPACFGR